jgi:hypothetical protein
MTKLLITCSTFLFGTLGWYVGEPLGLFSAFVVSMFGTGLGVYLGRKLADRWGF